jgi:tRNA(His) 5'-end guanylyltransferase
MIRDDLGNRMKNYENVPKISLMRRTPVAIRLDMRAGHTFTRGFCKPFDKVFMESMQKTMKYLCENVAGCVVGYTQSDEITLILTDYEKLETQAWFDNQLEKLVSISASMATFAFNKVFTAKVQNMIADYEYQASKGFLSAEIQQEINKYLAKLQTAADKGAMFDSRAFNIPKEEVTNLILWRQLDAIRNSINSVGQANFTHKELQGKSSKEVKQMLLEQKNIDWNKLPITQQRGSCCIKNEYTATPDSQTKLHYWIIDNNIPIFKGEDRAYIDKKVGL